MRLAVFDIDGVLADVRHRVHLVDRRRHRDWDAFFAAAVSDRLKDWDHASIVRILVGFNVGVELAQMSVIFASAGLLWAMARAGLPANPLRRGLCLAVAIAGFAVMAWRIAGLSGLV